MKGIIYIRVSTTRQQKSGLGLEDQRRACAELAHSLGITDIEYYHDVTSGATKIEERPGLTQALSMMKKGDIMIVLKRDRISREMLQTLSLEFLIKKRGGSLRTVNTESHDDPVTNLILKTMADLFAEVERITISRRTKSALQVLINQRRRVGNIRFGFRLAPDGKHLTKCKREQNIIAKVALLRNDGKSLREIAEYLNRNRIQTRTGAPWQVSQVQRLLIAQNYAQEKTS